VSRERHVAVVTGAARGIGKRICVELAERGYRVAANDLGAPDDTTEELRSAGADALALPGDVSDEATVRAMVETVMGAFGRADVLVNNAGISTIVPAEETTLADWNRTLAVNLTGPFLMCREFGKAMLEAGSGSVVNVSSVAGLLGVGGRAAYNASRHGLVGLTHTLAAEWGGRGVRVNAVWSAGSRRRWTNRSTNTKKLRLRFRASLTEDSHSVSIDLDVWRSDREAHLWGT
jgi:NAD(P)-dependent dehydrogenase (short-subunit alcohol dehydrogenase family)